MQYSNIIFIVVLIAAFYFLLIRPQQQQTKRQREMVESLRPGTRIVTVGGIFATVVDVEDDRLRVAVADGSELEIAKRAVGSVLPGEDEGEDAGEGDEEPEVAHQTADDSDETQGDSPDV
jgi:preprotein translocase subunit YajC